MPIGSGTNRLVNDSNLMKTNRLFWILILMAFSLTSCGRLSSLFKRKSGCPSNGKNVGAEQILSGDPKAMKSVRHAKKFRS